MLAQQQEPQQRSSGLIAWVRAQSSSSYVTPPLTWRGSQPAAGYMPRAEAITDEHIGSTFLVHSGKDYKRVKVTPQMVMHKFGEFVQTRKRRPQPKKVVANRGQKKR